MPGSLRAWGLAKSQHLFISKVNKFSLYAVAIFNVIDIAEVPAVTGACVCACSSVSVCMCPSQRMLSTPLFFETNKPEKPQLLAY